MSEAMQEALRARAQELLEVGEIGCVIGYELSPKGRVRPTFVYEAADAGRLVWNDQCTHNLVVYLRDRQPPMTGTEGPARVAVVAKPCDVRALNVLLHEGQMERDDIFVIGVACEGMVECDSLAERCVRCTEREPVFYDTLIGQATKPPLVEEQWDDVKQLAAMDAQQRLAFWTREFDRCIRCYACRQACPGCYCFECMAEQVDPSWMGIAIELPEKAFFHVMRAYHLAGRCVDCDACEHACPMGIRLSLLNRELAREVAELFDYRAGDDPATPPPLATFRKDEDLPL